MRAQGLLLVGSVCMSVHAGKHTNNAVFFHMVRLFLARRERIASGKLFNEWKTCPQIYGGRFTNLILPTFRDRHLLGYLVIITDFISPAKNFFSYPLFHSVIVLYHTTVATYTTTSYHLVSISDTSSFRY